MAAPQFLASQAGAHILEEGGNAIDAAIAANAVMGVVQPYVNGIGGDLFAVYYKAKSGKLYGLNSSGWTPNALTIDYIKAHHIDHINPIGVETIDIPGAVAGWEAMRARFGTLPFSQTLAPAIYYAENGFPLAERNARYWVAKSCCNSLDTARHTCPTVWRPRLEMNPRIRPWRTHCGKLPRMEGMRFTTDP